MPIFFNKKLLSTSLVQSLRYVGVNIIISLKKVPHKNNNNMLLNDLKNNLFNKIIVVCVACMSQDSGILGTRGLSLKVIAIVKV